MRLCFLTLCRSRVCNCHTPNFSWCQQGGGIGLPLGKPLAEHPPLSSATTRPETPGTWWKACCTNGMAANAATSAANVLTVHTRVVSQVVACAACHAVSIRQRSFLAWHGLEVSAPLVLCVRRFCISWACASAPSLMPSATTSSSTSAAPPA